MAKKKNNGNRRFEESASKNIQLEKEGIIVLNEGRNEEEELDILGILGDSEDDEEEIVIDTTYLDEELGISDIVKESGIQVMKIGGGESKKKNKKDKNKKDKKNVDREESDDSEEDVIKKISDTFSMVLSGKEFAPIPYPFKDDEEFNDSFAAVVGNIDHMTIARFIRNNPDVSLKDAYNYVFTISENNKSKDGSKNLLEMRMETILNNVSNSVNLVVSKIIDNANEDAEVLDDMINNMTKDLDRTTIGKFLRVIYGKSFADLVRASLNNKKSALEDLESKFSKLTDRLSRESDVVVSRLMQPKLKAEEFINMVLGSIVDPVVTGSGEERRPNIYRQKGIVEHIGTSKPVVAKKVTPVVEKQKPVVSIKKPLEIVECKRQNIKMMDTRHLTPAVGMNYNSSVKGEIITVTDYIETTATEQEEVKRRGLLCDGFVRKFSDITRRESK